MKFDKLVNDIDFVSPHDLFNNIKFTISQNEMINFINEKEFTIIYKRRQEGVSTAICAYLLWLLINNPKYTIAFIYVSNSEREMFRQMINMNLSKIEEMFNVLGFDEKFTQINHNLSCTSFSNGSSIHYWPKKSSGVAGKGRRLDCVYISELNYRDDFMRIISSILPCLTFSKNRKIIITSTELRSIKENFLMNGDGIDEYWNGDFFDGKRIVLFEKNNNI